MELFGYDLDDFIYKIKFPNKMQILQLEKKYYINNSTNHFSVKELNKKFINLPLKIILIKSIFMNFVMITKKDEVLDKIK